MSRIGTLAGLALMAAFSVSSALAQQPQGVRLAGKITAVDGQTITVKTAQEEAKVTLPANVMVIAGSKGTLADIKQGSYIGVGAARRPMAARRRSGWTSSPSRSAASARASGHGIGPTPP